ncbi:MAG: hypothetical protein ACLP7Q_05550 [Isosphaeraceae bacterium]
MAETFAGEVCSGVVVFKGSPPLPGGTKVRVELVDIDAALSELSALLLGIASKVTSLPADLAENDDYYLHGTPKRLKPQP